VTPAEVRLDTRLTVGILSHFFPPDPGGIPRIHSYTVNRYSDLGIRPVVITKPTSASSGRGAEPWPTVRIPGYGKLYELARAVREGRFDGVDPFERSGFTTLVPRLAAQAAGVFRRYGVALVNSHIFADLAVGVAIADELDVPHVHVGHSAYRDDSYVRDEARRLGTDAPIVSQEYIKRLLSSGRVDRFVVHTAYMRRKYVELGVAEHKIEVASPGVDLTLFRRDPEAGSRLRARLHVPDGVLVTCPSLRKQGFDYLLRAVSSLPGRLRDRILVLCCDIDALPRRYARLAERLGLSRQVRCASFAANAMAAVYSASDVVVLCSTEEGIGLPVLEARACGTPVIAHRFGPFLELVDDGDDGYLIDLGDTTAMAHAIEEAVSDSRRRRRIVERGLERVRAYSHHRLAVAYARVFAAAVADRKRA
jgi:glycosyltransferase involved in cell wall biosynthesis